MALAIRLPETFNKGNRLRSNGSPIIGVNLDKSEAALGTVDQTRLSRNTTMVTATKILVLLPLFPRSTSSTIVYPRIAWEHVNVGNTLPVWF